MYSDSRLFMSSNLSDIERVRAEIASVAARLIAEDGSDYQYAKQKAAHLVLGQRRTQSEVMPDNAQIEEEVRAYQALFQSDTQPARLRALRELALHWMNILSPFEPHVVGAVLNGTAGEHSDLHLHLFAESPKDVAIFLLNQGIDYDTSEYHGEDTRTQVETLSFVWHGEGIMLTVFESHQARQAARNGAGRKIDRANAQRLMEIMQQERGTE